MTPGARAVQEKARHLKAAAGGVAHRNHGRTWKRWCRHLAGRSHHEAWNCRSTGTSYQRDFGADISNSHWAGCQRRRIHTRVHHGFFGGGVTGVRKLVHVGVQQVEIARAAGYGTIDDIGRGRADKS